MQQPLQMYSTGSRILHWLIALLVVGMLVVGFLLASIPKSYQPTAYLMHKSIGLVVLFLMILRFFWLKISGRPALPAVMPLWEKVFARIVQYGFYVLLIAMPLSGWIMSTAAAKAPNFFGLVLIPFPGITPDPQLAEQLAQAHEIIAYVIIVFICLHVAGALKHYFIDKDDVVATMWRSRR